MQLAMNDKPDYNSYTYEQLLDVQKHVDKEKYPDRYKEVCDLLARMDKPQVAKKIKKKAVKFTNSDHVFAGLTCFVIFAYHLWKGSTIGRHGGFSAVDEPLIYWFFNSVFIGLGIYNFGCVIFNLSKSKNA